MNGSYNATFLFFNLVQLLGIAGKFFKIWAFCASRSVLDTVYCNERMYLDRVFMKGPVKSGTPRSLTKPQPPFCHEKPDKREMVQ